MPSGPESSQNCCSRNEQRYSQDAPGPTDPSLKKLSWIANLLVWMLKMRQRENEDFDLAISFLFFFSVLYGLRNLSGPNQGLNQGPESIES